MSRTSKVALAAAVVVVGTFLVGTLAAAAVIYREGSITVSVDENGERGQRLRLIVPAALVRAGLFFVPDCAWHDARAGIGDLSPVLASLSTSLANAPDGTFVEVHDGDEHVVIAKSGSKLIIDVDTKDESVRVSVPFRTVSAVAHRVASGV